MKDYEGGWKGEITHPKCQFKITLQEIGDSLLFGLERDNMLIQGKTPNNNGEIHFQSAHNFKFIGNFNPTKSQVNGFIFNGGYLQYHVTLHQEQSGKWIGYWHPFMVKAFESNAVYLSVENAEGEHYQAYPIFSDRRFTGTWCDGFQKNGEEINFTDFKTGFRFKGQLKGEEIYLEILLGDIPIHSIRFVKSTDDWEIGSRSNSEDFKLKQPQTLADGWEVGKINRYGFSKEKLKALLDSLSTNKFPNTHSILIARNNHLLVEQYFDGYNRNTPHDTRSASKSISSALIGLAIDQKILDNPHQKIAKLVPAPYQKFFIDDSLKLQIDLHSLLTMSSGIDAIDFGIDRASAASEDAYQSTNDWAETVLKANMLYAPSLHANYGSANPFLLGVVLAEQLKKQSVTTLDFMDENLFKPLGIQNYIVQKGSSGSPYFGGGMYLTPRDLLKFGQLYLDGGKWKGKQIISEEWVQKSFQNYLALENTYDKSGYGYLWWHHQYEWNGNPIQAIEARGAGGQNIFVIPSLEMVVVITSGNYRNGKHKQPEYLMQHYILPALSESVK